MRKTPVPYQKDEHCLQLESAKDLALLDKPHSPMSLVKSKQRVADHGEVFTPEWMVEAMLDLVNGVVERVNSNVLEPACGDGNFLVPVLRRKLAQVEIDYGKSEFERRQYGLRALMSVYGIELLPDNIAQCREKLLKVFAEYLSLSDSDDLYRAGIFVLSQNLIHGDALKMRTQTEGCKACKLSGTAPHSPATRNHTCQPIVFAEWGYLTKAGKFQRRDFRLDNLTIFGGADSLFAHNGKDPLFTPIKTYPKMTVAELAALEKEVSP